MNNTASAQVSANKPGKSPVPSSLKADNLRHLSDHGLAVQFADRKLAALAEHLNSRDAVTELTAGQSRLTITRLGNVTMTEAYRSVGTRHENRIHYLDGSLKYSFAESRDATAFATLKAVIFGTNMPRIYSPVSGAEQDALRTHLKAYAWTLAGVSGLRAQALEHVEAELKLAVDRAHGNIEGNTRELARAKTLTPEYYVECRTRVKEQARQDADYHAAKAATLTEWLNATDLSDEAKREAGVFTPYYAGAFPYLPNTNAVSSHPIQSANYSATVTPDGQITLSSGIVCEFGLPRLVQWLKGEATAPTTRYGTVTKVACATPDGKPVYLIKCGCHWVDAARCSPELAELLKPDFEVALTPGRPRVELPTDASPEQAAAFRAEANVRLALARDKAEASRRAALEAMVTHLARINQEETSIPERIARLMQAIADAQTTLTNAEAALAAPRQHLGATLDQLTPSCRALANAFSTFKL